MIGHLRRWGRARSGELLEGGDESAGLVTGMGTDTGEVVRVQLYGLPYDCWSCGEVSVPLVALALGEEPNDVEDLVICDDDETLGLADRLLDADVRKRHRLGSIRPRYTRASGTTYLANECAFCRAVFGRFPLFHEALPEALATGGLGSLVLLSDLLVRSGSLH